MIVILDYGVGNIDALTNMFEYLGVDAAASSDPAEIASAERLLLPGVGAFDRAMSELRARNLVAPLNEAVRQRGASLLGICLGMQLLARGSEEGVEPGLGLIEADVVRIPQPEGMALKVPHMGWGEITVANPSLLFPSEATGERFYFAHSYHMVCDRAADVTATVRYGSDLTCAVRSGRVQGAQFHPEKSHRFGMRVLKAFAET
jgi:glutamine amidotransferase